MFGVLGAAFGLGKSLAGLSAPGQARQVTTAENKFNDRVAGITAKRVARDARYQLGAQQVQIGATGGGFYGSMLFLAADDARKARERVSNVHLQNAQRKVANAAGDPSQSGANSRALGAAANFGQRLFNFGLGG